VLFDEEKCTLLGVSSMLFQETYAILGSFWMQIVTGNQVAFLGSLILLSWISIVSMWNAFLGGMFLVYLLVLGSCHLLECFLERSILKNPRHYFKEEFVPNLDNFYLSTRCFSLG
jgi:hypothetical protein